MITFTVDERGVERQLAAIRALNAALRTRAGASQIGARLTNEALRSVKALTPVQKNANRSLSNPKTSRGHPRIRPSWRKVVDVQTTEQYRARIVNRAESIPGGVVVLGSLEFGAKPHVIAPRGGRRTPSGKPPRLAWISVNQALFGGRRTRRGIVSETRTKRSGTGQVVYARRVQHPGHPPFRMIGHSRRRMLRITTRVRRQLGLMFQQIWSGGGGGGSFTVG